MPPLIMRAIIYNHSLTIMFARGIRAPAGVSLIKAVNGIKNVGGGGGIKAASFKITRKEKKCAHTK